MKIYSRHTKELILEVHRNEYGIYNLSRTNLYEANLIDIIGMNDAR